jgi:Protein of unknown function (DUF3300)
MNLKASWPTFVIHTIRNVVAIICVAVLVPGDISLLARTPLPAQAGEEAAKIPGDQLDSLVAPIALYPDPLLSQTLVASTYPLEIIQLQQWLLKNKNLKDKALADAVKKQDWDPSIQAMAALPDVVKQLAENIKWTTDLGNAFLAQQSDVMDAVQRMRKKAQDAGNLKSTQQQKVETKVIESKQVVVIEQASPEVIYVPSYNPTVVYGPAVYPYPPIAYPPAGYYAAGMALSFGIGVAMGAAWGGGWGYHSNWGGNNNIYVNNNNNFVNNSNRQNYNNRQNVSNRPAGGNNNWQHNPQHRGGAPYSNRATAKQYGGTSRGDSMATRQANARQNQPGGGNRQQVGASNPSSFRGGQSRVSDRSAGGRDSSNRGAGAGASNMSSNRGGGDRVGDRSVSSGGGSRGSSAFGGGSGSSARSSSARGSSSMGSRGGGGGMRGGGGRRR